MSSFIQIHVSHHFMRFVFDIRQITLFKLDSRTQILERFLGGMHACVELLLRHAN